MIRLLLLLVFCVPLLAQNPITANFPTSVPTDSDLPVATNRWTGVTAEALDATETGIDFEVDDLDSLTVPAIITCENELILVSSISTDTATVSRGLGANMTASGTGDSHSSGITCRANMTAQHVNAAYAEIKAIAAALGIGIWGTDDLVPYVASGVLSGESAFTYDPDTNTLTADNINTGSGGSPIALEGATADDFETTIAVTDPTADRTITLQDASGTVAFTGDITTHAADGNAHGNWAGSASEGGPATTALALNANPAALTSGTYCADLNADGTCATEEDLDDLGGTVGSSQVETHTKSVWFGSSLSADGTQCADPTEVTIGSWGKQFAFICADNDGSTLTGSIQMPDGWNAGTVTFELAYIQDAADTNALNSDIAARCVGATETPLSYGTEVAIDDAAVTGSDAIDNTTSGAVTPAGTCAAGDYLQFQWQLDATGTTTAMSTLNILGIKMEYTTSLAD